MTGYVPRRGAGVNVDHAPSLGVREEPNCDQQRFNLTEPEFDIVMGCESDTGGDQVQLKEVGNKFGKL